MSRVDKSKQMQVQLRSLGKVRDGAIVVEDLHPWKRIIRRVIDQDGTPQLSEEETEECIFRGNVVLFQSRRGYRTSIDSLLLPFVAKTYADRLFSGKHMSLRMADVGSGCGLLSVLYGMTNPGAELLLFEKQPQMLERSRYNLQANNIDKSRIEYFLADVGHGLQKRELRGTVDTVMMNPPFYEKGCSRHPPSHEERRIGHFETTATINDFVQFSRDLLRPGGQLLVAYPADGLERLRSALDSSGFGYTQTIAVVHRKDDPRPCKRVITVSLAIGRSADVKPNFIWKPGDSHCLQPTALEDCWTLLLHEADAGDEEYHPEIENFLRSLRSHARPEDNCER